MRSVKVQRGRLDSATRMGRLDGRVASGSPLRAEERPGSTGQGGG